MSFVKLEKTSPAKNSPTVHATFNSEIGLLHILKNGADLIPIQLQGNLRVDIFVDPGTLRIGLNWNPKSEFQFSLTRSGSLKLQYVDLSNKIKQDIKYTVQAKHPDFDIFLVPILPDA